MRVSRWCTGTVIAIKLNTLWQHTKKGATEKESFSNEDVLRKKILKTFKYPHYTTILLWH